MDLVADTESALDWALVLEALSTHARTATGRAAALALGGLGSVDAVRLAMDETDEVILAEGDADSVPVGGVLDIADITGRAMRQGLLDKSELRAVGRTLEALHELSDWLVDRDVDVPILADLGARLVLDAGPRDVLSRAFDPMGELSATAWPELGHLRQRISDLHVSVRRTLDDILGSDEMKDALQDRYVTQRGDRYVIPVKLGWKRKDMGIVHAMSASGQTAFVEPTQVIALNNELRLAEGELEQVERRILTQLSHLVGGLAPMLLPALQIATRVDLACSRAGLARALNGVRPIVRDEGVVALREARHPLLALRGVPVVANDLLLTPQQPALIISGPNTGGKTVALKTLGVCAMLVRIGCFVPADAGSRVDLFPSVLALIGDHQTVQGDHSSFSSHLAALKIMLDDARPGCLYLVDEIASGTDPQQGAALAHAWLEALIDRGPRAVITTHFHRLKTVGATDGRFAMAGMQFAEGRPTFRLFTGMSGESHAVDIARRIGLPASLLERTRALMGDDEQSLADVLSALEAERTRAEEATRSLRKIEAELASRAASLAEREAEIKRRASELEQREAGAFLARLSAAETAIGAVVADLQRDPSHRKAEAARAAVDALRALAPEAPAPVPVPVAVGDHVKIRSTGAKGLVLAVDDKQVQVRVGALTLRVKPEDVTPTQVAPQRPKPTVQKEKPRESKKSDLSDAIRLPNNTCDLRGLRVEEGLEAAEKFMDEAQIQRFDTVFVLTGHGTGAMKDALRRWLSTCRYVSSWCAGSAHQGGDAYTVVALR